MKICICGGGSLGHVIAGRLAHEGRHVTVLTRRAEQWCDTLRIDDCRGNTFCGRPACITSRAEEAVAGADIVLLCLPGFAIESELQAIAPHLSEGACVGCVVCSTGFFFAARRILGPGAHLFGLQRAPYIARVSTYGHSARLLGYKKELQAAFMNVADSETLCRTLSNLFGTPVRRLGHFLEASLTNSNPLLHPTRLYGLFGNWQPGTPYRNIPGFYSDWDDESSALLIACDEEFQRILTALPVRLTPIPRLLDYYESTDPPSLTRKIRSISAFQGIQAPMKTVEGGYVPDFTNRYFTEDFPFGLLIIRSAAELTGTPTPHIDRVLEWGQRMMKKEYLREGKLCGKDLAGTGFVAPDLFRQLTKP